MSRTIAILVVLVLAALALIIELAALRTSKSIVKNNATMVPSAMSAEYSIVKRNIEEDVGGLYRYDIELRARVKAGNDTTTIPVIYYKYQYFRCYPDLELHLKKGKWTEFSCKLSFTTDYSPVIDKCSGMLNKHETIRCGNISFMIEDVIDLENSMQIISEMISGGKGIKRWFVPYLERLYSMMHKDGKREEKRFAALVVIDDGNGKHTEMIRYGPGCEQCYTRIVYNIKTKEPMHSLGAMELFGCSDDSIPALENSGMFSYFRIERRMSRDCAGENTVSISRAGINIDIDIPSSLYYPGSKPDMMFFKATGVSRKVGFDKFEMVTEGGSFMEAMAPMDIYYLKPGCILLDTATDSDSVYEAMDKCKSLTVYKHDRIWVKDTPSYTR